MGTATQLVFFQSVFASEKAVLATATELVKNGITFTADFMTLKASYKSANYSTNLTTGTNTLMKGLADPSTESLNKNKIRIFLKNLWDTVLPGIDCPMTSSALESMTASFKPLTTTSSTVKGPSSPGYALVLIDKGSNIVETLKLIRQVFQVDLMTAKKAVDLAPVTLVGGLPLSMATDIAALFVGVCGLTAQPPGTAVPLFNLPADWPLSIPSELLKTAVASDNKASSVLESKTATITKASPASLPKVSLKNATQLGQRVNGTSADSTYHVIALSPRLNVAAKITTTGETAISIRFEGKPTSDEISKIKAIQGASWKGDYGSVHMKPGSVPYSRVIGAILLGLEMGFTQQVTDVSGLVLNGN